MPTIRSAPWNTSNIPILTPTAPAYSWPGIGLAIAAAIVSLVSLWLGLHSAHSMEKLLASNSFPYLEIGRSTHAIPSTGVETDIRRKVEYEMLNEGIGPARINWVELTCKGKPMRDLLALVEACCDTQGKGNGLHARGNVQNSPVRPGASLVMFSWTEPTTPTFSRPTAQP